MEVLDSSSGLSEHSHLRKRIRDIQNDSTVNQREKAKLVQSLMDKSSTCLPAISKRRIDNLDRSCQHYNKSCSQFHFSCCDVIDPCHRCHLARGECHKRPAEISSIVCNVCSKQQPPAQDCIDCGERMGKSYCDICKIWTPLDIYHCEKCGFCRVGKAEEVFHCDTCDACFGVEGREQHRCARIQLKDACCPLCLESVHSAQKPSCILSCGHVLHADCWKESAHNGEFRCPTCRKSLFDMQAFWASLRRSIELQPIPKKFFPIRIGDTVQSPFGEFVVTSKRLVMDSATGQTKTMCDGYLPHWTLSEHSVARAVFEEDSLDNHKMVKIFCYDCEAKTTTKFHFVGLECQQCKSFNTCQM